MWRRRSPAWGLPSRRSRLLRGQDGAAPQERHEARVPTQCVEHRITLQRRLQEEGSSFQQLLDDTRRDLAVQHLAQPDLAPLEIAYLLGFADPSNFYRAFKRWFGVTPGEYRLAARSRQ